MDLSLISEALHKWAESKPLVARAWVFGSRVRGTAHPDSDLDIAIELDMQARAGMDETGGLVTWAFETNEWESELAAALPFKIDLQQYRGSDTPTIHSAIASSGQLVYVKPCYGTKEGAC